jgi:hypothetical protein
LNGARMLFGVLFSVIGSGYALYGKRQGEPEILVVGIALMVYPYLVASALWTFVIGLLLCLVPVARAKGWL